MVGSLPCGTGWNIRQDVVSSAVFDGIWMSKSELQQLCLSFKIPKPNRGSGKNRNVIKYDIACAVVNFFFPEAEAIDKERMVKGLMGESKKVPDVELLEHVALLDPENAAAFEKQKQEAVRQLESIIRKKAVVEEEERKFEKHIPDLVAESSEPKKAMFKEKEEKDCRPRIRFVQALYKSVQETNNGPKNNGFPIVAGAASSKEGGRTALGTHAWISQGTSSRQRRHRW